MSRYSVDLEEIKKEKHQLDSLSENVKARSSDIKKIQSEAGDYLASDAAARVLSRINNISDDVLNQAVLLDSFADALGFIANEYERREEFLKSIAEDQTFYGEEYSRASAKGADKRSGWRQFWDWLFRKKVDTKYTHTKDEQQEAADLEMKIAIRRLTADNNRYSEEYWAGASADERKVALNSYLNDVKRVMRVEVVNSNINWIDREPNSEGRLTLGSYSDFLTRVTINEYVINNWSSSGSYDLYSTVVHELRHAYQHEAISHPTKYIVSKETIDAWAESFKTYDKYAGDYNSYLNILVERDARSFADQD